MGAPKRFRKQYDKPTLMWDRERIDEEHKLIENFGLRNLKEVWIAASELRRIRRNVREVLSGRASKETGSQIIARLAKYNIVSANATLDDLLITDIEAILKRRLQTIVADKGMARTVKQARQLITHGFISVNGRRVKSPGYLVTTGEESKIAYYKPINISAPTPQAPAAPQPSAEKAEEAQTQ